MKYLLITLSILSTIIIALIYQALKPKPSLPIYNPHDVSSEMVSDSIRHIKKYHHIADFELVDQTGAAFGSVQLKEKIHIADFFFTTCPGICPVLTDQMKRLQETFISDRDIVLVSFSVTPEIDSVAVLEDYANRKGVDVDKWHLLTGDKQTIYNLARNSYMAVKDRPETSIENDMIHTENFVLVDPKGRIRGFYDGTNTKSIDSLVQDIKILKTIINR